MKTLDEFLDEIERECCSPYSLTAAKIIREMSAIISGGVNESEGSKAISKILNGEEDKHG